jgi:uncharacterized membrane-anchored protein
MKQWPIWFFTLLVLLVINLQIYTKEQTLKQGQTVLLQLVPVDPRSLMQGDYMRLRYAIATKITDEKLADKGKLILRIDEKQRGDFVRMDNGTPLNENEQRLVYRNRQGLRLGAESFFFEEGQADRFEQAKFGELKVDQDGNSVLVGLRDEGLQQL